MNKTEEQPDNPERNKDLETAVVIGAPVDKVFKSITEEIPLWWTTMFEGKAKENGDVFTVRFGENVFKTMRVDRIVSYSKAHWTVIDTIIDIPELENKREWLNTTIEWELSQRSDGTLLTLRHVGLNPKVECYQICESGWHSFLSSLVKYNETGKGTPYKEG